MITKAPVNQVSLFKEEDIPNKLRFDENGWFRINVEPQTSPRPRMSKRGIAYMPSWYKDYKKLIKEELKRNSIIPYDYSEINIIAFFTYPKSTSRKKLIEGAKMRVKPDYDNAAKALTDCLEELELIKNDSQISDGSLKKRYTLNKEGYILIKLI